jgi:hypothetical protein
VEGVGRLVAGLTGAEVVAPPLVGAEVDVPPDFGGDVAPPRFDAGDALPLAGLPAPGEVGEGLEPCAGVPDAGRDGVGSVATDVAP